MRTTSRPHNPVDLLFGAYRRGILGLLLLRPGESFFVRQISRLSGVPAGSLHRELKLLADAGLLTRSVSGNQVRYQADRTCPIYEELAAIFRKTTGLADVLREALAPLASRIRLALVFGSVAQGRERGGSDVDVLVTGEATFEEVVAALSPTRERLGREVNPVVMTEAAFSSKRSRGDRFLSRILREPRILVIGDARDLGEPAQDRRADVAALCGQFHVRRLDLFGSAARGTFDPERSDLDFVVTFDDMPPADFADAFFGLQEALVALFGRPVDLLTAESIRNPYLRESIDRNRVALYAA